MDRYMFKGFPIYDQVAFAKLEMLFNENRSLIMASLPWLVSELIEDFGFRLALEFIYKHGGRKIYLKNDRADLARKMDLNISDRLHRRILCFSSSSGYVEIPSPWGVSEAIRRAMIMGDYSKGMNREEIRQTYGLSSRALTNIFSVNRG